MGLGSGTPTGNMVQNPEVSGFLSPGQVELKAARLVSMALAA